MLFRELMCKKQNLTKKSNGCIGTHRVVCPSVRVAIHIQHRGDVEVQVLEHLPHLGVGFVGAKYLCQRQRVRLVKAGFPYRPSERAVTVI